MICSKAEALTFLGKAGSATDAELGLLALLHPLVERKLKDHLEQELEYATHTEYLPASGAGLDEVDLADYDPDLPPLTRWRTSNRLQLRHTPVWSDATLAVYHDKDALAGQATGAFAEASKLTLGSDYFLDVGGDAHDGVEYSTSGVLVRQRMAWSAKPRSIKVVYHGGWQPAQFDTGKAQQIKLAAMQAVAYNWQMNKHLATTGGAGLPASESIGKYSISYASQAAASMGMRITIPSGVIADLENFRNFGVLL